MIETFLHLYPRCHENKKYEKQYELVHSVKKEKTVLAESVIKLRNIFRYVQKNIKKNSFRKISANDETDESI